MRIIFTSVDIEQSNYFQGIQQHLNQCNLNEEDHLRVDNQFRDNLYYEFNDKLHIEESTSSNSRGRLESTELKPTAAKDIVGGKSRDTGDPVFYKYQLFESNYCRHNILNFNS